MKILSNTEKKEEEQEEEKEEEEIKPEAKISPLEIKILNELQILQFLDNIIEDSLLYIYNKTVKYFQKDMENFIENSESELRDVWRDNKKEFENIYTFSEEFAKKNGIKRSLQKETLIYSIPIYAIVIGFTFIIYLFPQLFSITQEFMMYILFIPFLFLCITNSIVSRMVINKRMKFRDEKSPILKEQIKDSIESIRNVNQIIINDIKDLILENEFVPSKFKAYLYNKEYENIKVLETKEQHKIPIHLIGIDVDQNP